MELRPIDRYETNYREKTPLLVENYKFGIANPRRSWQGATKAGEANYKASVTKAAAEGRFGKGVGKVSDSEWQDPALALGADRWSTGVTYNAGKWRRKWEPFYSALSALRLSPRGLVDSDSNYNRSKEVGRELHKKKLAVLGAA